ncbi:hypothetical protein CVM52_13470 [Pseudooceanicola lipolyticus]|uniref:Uncharacterized protein n=1 Tax=Pseudooceanicola lipolyticus TaxID=2029104 RepID=A0A2M8J036_9RHOB|nr:hypothetical protein CVM52_13470 [Pseudooceanicola lipolyticus]
MFQGPELRESTTVLAAALFRSGASLPAVVGASDCRWLCSSYSGRYDMIGVLDLLSGAKLLPKAEPA